MAPLREIGIFGPKPSQAAQPTPALIPTLTLALTLTLSPTLTLTQTLTLALALTLTRCARLVPRLGAAGGDQAAAGHGDLP